VFYGRGEVSATLVYLYTKQHHPKMEVEILNALGGVVYIPDGMATPKSFEDLLRHVSPATLETLSK
jgi:hypothetical protein